MEFEDLFPNFTPEEFECSCGSDHCPRVGIKPWFVSALQDLRLQCGFPLVINSGFRCLEHNRRIGSKDSSRHVEGVAADISIVKLSAGQKHRLLRKASQRFGGVGVYRNFFHLDLRNLRDGKSMWIGQ